jgi:hypothetical protein
MQTLRAVPDSNDPTKTTPLLDAKPGGAADKIACVLTYLRSLEQSAEQFHGDNDDWRHGRYLVYGVIVEAIKSAERQSA